jgi:hypothetical protein
MVFFYCKPCLALVEHAQVDERGTVASAPETNERRRCSEIKEKNDGVIEIVWYYKKRVLRIRIH